MWPRRSHMLVPLTILLSIKRKFKYTQVKKDAFDIIKEIVARNTLLTYQDFNKKIKIHTNARTFQLVAFFIQEGKPIAFCSRKLTNARQLFTVT